MDIAVEKIAPVWQKELLCRVFINLTFSVDWEKNTTLWGKFQGNEMHFLAKEWTFLINIHRFSLTNSEI